MNIFPTLFLPPADFFVYTWDQDEIWVDIHEHFVKQTFRNRCHINTAAGSMPVSVHLDKCRRNHVPVKDIRISYRTNWNKLAWRAITSAYNNSPYFLYYQDDFSPFFEKKFEWLIDYNLQVLHLCQKLIGRNIEIKFTEKYFEDFDGRDFREYYSKKKLAILAWEKYTQVFDYSDFVPNLSILDLICNMGPETKTYLTKHAFILQNIQV
jgi:hypothetical protein